MNKHSKYRKLLDSMELGVSTGEVDAHQLYQWTLETLDKAEQEELALKAHIVGLMDALQNPDWRLDCGAAVLAKTPAQSLATIQAQAVTDLISECSYSTQVNGIATSIIDVDSAISYADRLKGEG